VVNQRMTLDPVVVVPDADAATAQKHLVVGETGRQGNQRHPAEPLTSSCVPGRLPTKEAFVLPGYWRIEEVASSEGVELTLAGRSSGVNGTGGSSRSGAVDEVTSGSEARSPRSGVASS